MRNYASDSKTKSTDGLFDTSKGVTRLSTNDSADTIVTKTLMEKNNTALGFDDVAVVDSGAALHKIVTVNGQTFDVFDCWWNTKLAMSTIELIHTFASPWWLTLVGSVVVLRSAFVPFMVSNLRNATKMTEIQPKMTEITNAMKLATNKEDKVALQMKMMSTMKENGFKPFRPLLFAFMQLPFYFSFFRAQAVLIQVHAEEMATGGALWFVDLHSRDPYYALPIISSVIMLTSFEIGSESISEKYRGMFRVFMRFFAVASVPLLGWLPAGTMVFILSHNVFSLVWALLMRIKAFRGVIGLPRDPPKITFTTPAAMAPAATGAPPAKRFYNAASGRIEEKPK